MGLTIPEAIRSLFKIDVAKESPLLKNKAMSLVRNRLIKVEKELNVQRSKVRLAKGQETVLFNALVLNAVFPDPKDVKAIFTNTKYRCSAVLILNSVLRGHDSLCGVALSSVAAIKLVECIDSDFDLYAARLPNPFKVLPQVALGENTNLLQALLAQAAMLDPVDSVLVTYLDGDFVRAQAMLADISDLDGPMAVITDFIEASITEAGEFDELIDQFKCL